MIAPAEEQVSILLYFLGGWLLLNILFAVGMFFRPTRKRPVGSAPDQAAAHSGDPKTGDHGQRRPTGAVRLLLFGIWLGDNRHSA